MIGAYTNCVFEEGWTIEDAKILYKEMIKLADYLLEDKNYEKYYTSLLNETIGQPLQEDRNWCGGNGDMLAIGTDGRKVIPIAIEFVATKIGFTRYAQAKAFG